ncbi:MAG TPA: MBL fold metallo-hydrolase, partial [Magnetospirillaceae bacterium]|nr:MBL fold metallo-hydrolase [Magnetospirillaceae bacterium]
SFCPPATMRVPSMKIHFLGVRGSIPTPLGSEAVRSKISAVVQRITRKDIESSESREKFLASLPEEIFSTVGGNTSCVEVSVPGSDRILFDAGTGIRNLGARAATTRAPERWHIFFSHFHWDHIQGLPFFAPAFQASSRIALYSPEPGLRETLEGQIRPPYFPVTMDMMRANLEFVRIGPEGVKLGEAHVIPRRMNHPGGCWSYSVLCCGKKAVYSTDTELGPEDFERTPDNTAYFREADALIIDAQYTLGEALEKYNWGHSSFGIAADFASTWGIKRLVLFHHEPANDDVKIQKLFQSAKWYADRLASKGLEVILARDGLVVEV